MMVHVTLAGDKAVREMLQRVGAASSGVMARTAEDVEVFVEGEAAKHNKTGKMVSSLEKVRIPGGWMVQHNPQVAPYTTFVHWGARAHIIRPKKKRALRWPGPRGFRFAKSVHHPGNKPDLWMDRAAAMAPRIFAQHLAAVLGGKD